MTSTEAKGQARPERGLRLAGVRRVRRRLAGCAFESVGVTDGPTTTDVGGFRTPGATVRRGRCNAHELGDPSTSPCVLIQRPWASVLRRSFMNNVGPRRCKQRLPSPAYKRESGIVPGLFALPRGTRYAERRSTCRPRRHRVRPDTNRTTAIASGNRILRPVKARAAGATFPYISTSLHSLPGHLLAADGSPQTHKPRALPQDVRHDELGEEQHRE